MNQDCIFCKIIAKQIPSMPLYEDNDLMVIKDIAPKATTHFLIIPKKHIKDLRDFTHADRELAAHMLLIANQLSLQHLAGGDFRLMLNNGHNAGQRVFHTHMHFLAGSKLPEF
ncbi:MAG: HIT domain-containing protein [Candidatus Babeliales bacterium]